MDVNEMLEKLKESFGTAESETVTENNYSFRNKNQQMKEDILFLDDMEKRANGKKRLYIKDKFGFDR